MPDQPPPPTPGALNWTAQDATLLHEFLRRVPQFMEALRRKRPKITKTENIEARAMSGSEVKGAEVILDAISDLTKGAQTVNEDSPFIGAGAP